MSLGHALFNGVASKDELTSLTVYIAQFCVCGDDAV